MIFMENMQLVVTLTKLLPSVCASVAGSCAFILGLSSTIVVYFAYGSTANSRFDFNSDSSGSRNIYIVPAIQKI